MGYFRKHFDADPSLVQSKSNEHLMELWKNDNPNHTPEDVRRARQNLANLKSALRRDLRHGKGGRGAAVAVLVANDDGANPLEKLEGRIDDCMLMARNMDEKGLKAAIHHLRLARNHVVWKLG
jgi:hypothetical protein